MVWNSCSAAFPFCLKTEIPLQPLSSKPSHVYDLSICSSNKFRMAESIYAFLYLKVDNISEFTLATLTKLAIVTSA